MSRTGHRIGRIPHATATLASVWIALVAICVLGGSTILRADPAAVSTAVVSTAAVSTAAVSTALVAGGGSQEDGEKKDPEKKDPEKKDGEEPDPEKKDGDDSDDADGKGKTKVFDTPEEGVVREKLPGFLNPSTLEWHEDGRVTMAFELGKKSGDHEDIFSTPVGAKSSDTFRWSVDQEDFVVGGIPGIRISDKGMVMLRAWYTGEVEAEIEYRQYINQEKRHIVAVLFQNEKGLALGSIFGNQCAMFSKGKIRNRTKEPIKGVVFDATARIKLTAKDGGFEAHRDGYLSSKQKYKPESFERGQIGILWDGSIAGIVGNIKVTGKLDYKKMKEEIETRRPRRR